MWKRHASTVRHARMSAKIAKLTRQIHREIERVPPRYRPLLLKLVHSFREGVIANGPDLSPADSLRQALHEVKSGKTRSIETLWEGTERR